MPGQVMNLDETLTVAGQVAPTIASRVSVTINTPSGKQVQFSGLTSAIGYFHDPANDIVVDEVGAWTISITVSPAGATSNGELEAPLPAGGVPGAINNQFMVYVTRPDTEPLTWNRGGDIDGETPTGALFNFTMNVPAGLKDTTAYRTVTMPGYILDDGILPSSTNAAPYQYSPPQLGLLFPSLETVTKGNDASASDVVQVTFAIIGTDDTGATQVFTRTFTFLNNRILSFEGE
jgi:hypothetical protein